MSPTGRWDAIRGEPTRGDEAQRAAEVLIREGLLRDAMSRLYYAALHYARALLLIKEEEPMTHEGVIRQFSFHFVKTGLITPEDGKTLGRLHRLRQEADCGVERGYAKGDLHEELQNLRRFKEAIDRALDSLGLPPPTRD